MKKVIMSFIAISIVCTLSMIVYASYIGTIQATKVQYPIIVDNVQVSKEIPMVSIEDRIYLPIRAMCDILNIKIEWKEEGRVDIMTGKEQEITKDFIISKDIALKIADIIFAEKFGQDLIEKTQVSVEEVDGAYKVYRGLEAPVLGGDGTIVISKKDGRIISIIAGE
jgi:hypothetical protein